LLYKATTSSCVHFGFVSILIINFRSKISLILPDDRSGLAFQYDYFYDDCKDYSLNDNFGSPK